MGMATPTVRFNVTGSLVVGKMIMPFYSRWNPIISNAAGMVLCKWFLPVHRGVRVRIAGTARRPSRFRSVWTKLPLCAIALAASVPSLALAPRQTRVRAYCRQRNRFRANTRRTLKSGSFDTTYFLLHLLKGPAQIQSRCVLASNSRKYHGRFSAEVTSQAQTLGLLD